jgi:type III secretory pathway component EscT
MNDVEETEAPAPSGKATASMICGILSLVAVCFTGPLVIPVAIAGLVLGLLSKTAANKGFAIAGIVTSAIALILSVLATAGLAFLFGVVEKANELNFEAIEAMEGEAIEPEATEVIEIEDR